MMPQTQDLRSTPLGGRGTPNMPCDARRHRSAEWSGRAGDRHVVAVSSFDGFHTSHRRLVETAGGLALRGGACAAIVVHDVSRPVLTPSGQRCRDLLACSVQRVDVLEVEGSSMTHGAKVADAIAERCPNATMVVLCASRDHGPQVRLSSLFRERRLEVVEVMREFRPTGDPVSWPLVAASIGAGDVAAATGLLGRPYTLRGEVVHGA